MAQARDNVIVATMLLLCTVLHHCEITNAATYTVGDDTGWDFNAAAWAKGKKFAAGDGLVFIYGPVDHNVVVSNKVGYDACTPSKSDKVYDSGKEEIMLVKGDNFFFCGKPGHCKAGMKMAITVRDVGVRLFP